MKRKELVETLLGEGFTEKTLVSFTDKQLSDLHERLVVKADDLKDPKVQQALSNPNTPPVQLVKEKTSLDANYKRKEQVKQGAYDGRFKTKVVKDKKKEQSKNWARKKTEMSEEKPSAGLSKEKKSEIVKKAKKGEDIGKKGKGFEKIEKKAKESGAKNPKAVAAAAMWKNVKRENDETKNWLKRIAENNFHSFTSKGEIMELIQTKLNEVEVGPNVKKGHNGIPEFMTYDAISKSKIEKPEETMESTTTKPVTKPKTTPTTKPGDKPKTPYQPGPGKNPKPKALKEKKDADK